jgi:hypothetical protein
MKKDLPFSAEGRRKAPLFQMNAHEKPLMVFIYRSTGSRLNNILSP